MPLLFETTDDRRPTTVHHTDLSPDFGQSSVVGRRSSIILLFLLITLGGCALGAGQSSGSAPANRPTSTPRPARPTPFPSPVLPVATPYATPRPEAGIYDDPEIGFRVDYPFYWNRSSNAVPGTQVQLANQPDNAFVLILRTPLGRGEEFLTAAPELHEQLGEWLGGMSTESGAQTTTAEGVIAWRSQHRLDYEDYGITFQADVLTVAHGQQLISLAAYGQSQHLGAEKETIEKIFASLKLYEPKIYGVPRSEAYVYVASEDASAAGNDPATGQGDKLVFGGLFSLDPQLQLRPELAESWEVSADGTVYTFYIRFDATFHNGRAITAHDVAYAWERAAAPETGSETVLTALGDIVGASERRAGKAERISGLAVLDDHTLQVTLVGPRPYFLLKLTSNPALVVDRGNVEQGANWYRKANGSGPYRLIRWELGRVKIYERNEQFYGEKPAVRYLIARLSDESGVYQYMLDELDQVTVPPWSLEYVRDSENGISGDLRQVPRMCTTFVSFDTTKAPFDDPKVRQAFALAIDGQRYQERTRDNGSLPARGLFPPGLPGYNASLPGIAYNADAARQKLAESSYGGAEKLPPITLTSSGYGFWIEPGVGVLVQMWQQTLGATIKIEQLDPQYFTDSVQNRERGNLFFWEWCADYPDPENFADALFHSEAQQNIGGYRNGDLDGLLVQARSEADVAKRMALYQQAEALLVDDAAAIFLNHRVDALLVAPRVKGPFAAPLTLPVERYVTLEVAQ
jgi:oligopeptide transport system substrate-binding protein